MRCMKYQEPTMKSAAITYIESICQKPFQSQSNKGNRRGSKRMKIPTIINPPIINY